MATIEYTVGSVGSGKSYRRCAHYLVEEFFNPDIPTDEYFWSNFPIKFEPFVDHLGVEQPGLFAIVEKRYGVGRGEVFDRVFVFPESEVETWIPRDGEPLRGPWSYFAENDIDISESHISIDEIHNFCPAGDRKAKKLWQEWLGEIRHEGATIEFLTQEPDKVNAGIHKAAQVRRYLIPSHDRRDPFFNIRMNDWYNFGTVFGKSYRPSVWQDEERNVKGKWKVVDSQPFWFKSELFGVYATNSESVKGKKSGKQTDQAYKRFGKLKLIRWFIFSNWYRFIFNKTVPRALGVIAILVGVQFLPQIIGLIGSATSKNVPNESSNGSNVVDVDPVFDEESLLLLAEEISRRQTESVVVGMVPDGIILANGLAVGVGGEVVVGGNAKKVKRIDYESRTVFYDGGKFVFVRDYGMQNSMAPEDDRIASIRERLQARGGDASKQAK